MITKTINNSGDIIIDEFPELAKDTFVTGLSTENNVDIDTLTTKIASTINQEIKTARPRNRKERRAYGKIIGKENLKELSTITETAKKLVYINLIQKLRELKEKETKNNETTIKND